MRWVNFARQLISCLSLVVVWALATVDVGQSPTSTDTCSVSPLTEEATFWAPDGAHRQAARAQFGVRTMSSFTVTGACAGEKRILEKMLLRQVFMLGSLIVEVITRFSG